MSRTNVDPMVEHFAEEALRAIADENPQVLADALRALQAAGDERLYQATLIWAEILGVLIGRYANGGLKIDVDPDDPRDPRLFAARFLGAAARGDKCTARALFFAPVYAEDGDQVLLNVREVLNVVASMAAHLRSLGLTP